VFVAVLGASNYTFAEATWTRPQQLGRLACPRISVPWRMHAPGGADNWRSGVKQPCWYEPELNRTYGDLATHYGVGILPARPYRPRDKAKAEQGVQITWTGGEQAGLRGSRQLKNRRAASSWSPWRSVVALPVAPA
jgi:transposase